MKRTAWFDRQFPTLLDSGVLPGIIERLDGTAARLTEKLRPFEATGLPAADSIWSIKKEIGHLADLEPLWLERALQIIGNEANLVRADLTNRKTHEAPHDQKTVGELIQLFNNQRLALVATLRQATDEDLEKAAIHPRLGTPMTLTDLAFFVAEHDDHHLAQMTLLLA